MTDFCGKSSIRGCESTSRRVTLSARLRRPKPLSPVANSSRARPDDSCGRGAHQEPQRASPIRLVGQAKTRRCVVPHKGAWRVSPDRATGIANLSCRCYRRCRERKRNTKLQPIDGQRHLHSLNPEQRSAVEYGIDGNAEPPPALLIAAGAGTGKTKALAHRVAHLILYGRDPQRLLLLTFTRRAALEMTRRSQLILAEARGNTARDIGTPSSLLPWSGTFHAIGSRLLRLHAGPIGLDPTFTVLDRADSADLLDLVRSERGLSQSASRFPRKDTCLAIYSYTVNAGCPLEETLAGCFPWCAEWPGELRRLFQAYVARKQQDNVLDYDDLLLYWRQAMVEPAVAAEICRRFDHVLVDEYQDTNRLQAEILRALRPDGSGLTVVGDDAQSIYSFRAASVRNILDFPGSVSPPAMVIALERNYRSTQPILAAANAVIAGAGERFAKSLYSTKESAELPYLVSVEDEAAQHPVR